MLEQFVQCIPALPLTRMLEFVIRGIEIMFRIYNIAIVSVYIGL